MLLEDECSFFRGPNHSKIKAMLSNLPVYYMSLLMMLLSVREKLDCIRDAAAKRKLELNEKPKF